MCIHELIMGIHNSVMDIHLGGIFALGFSYQYVFISSISADTRRKYCHFRRNSVKFNNDFIIALRVRWDKTTWPLRPRLHYIKHTVDWLYCSGCWFHLGSAYLHIILSTSNKIQRQVGGIIHLWQFLLDQIALIRPRPLAWDQEMIM